MKKEEMSYTQKEWNKFSPEIQEQLVKKYDIILPDYKTKKEKVVKVINMVDITTKEGQENFDKVMHKIDKGFQKVDSIFNELDNSLAKIGGNTKSLIDKPIGIDFDAKSVWKDPGSKGKKPKKAKGKRDLQGFEDYGASL